MENFSFIEREWEWKSSSIIKKNNFDFVKFLNRFLNDILRKVVLYYVSRFMFYVMWR